MFKSAEDVARSALRLIEMSETVDANDRSVLEVAAASLANHIADWHYEGREMSDDMKEKFEIAYAGWDALRAISNGTKHAKSMLATAQTRQVGLGGL